MMKKDVAENVKLYMAAVESYRTGSLTPILKEELKYTIQSRRLSEGKDEMVIEFEQEKTRKTPLRPDEIERQNKRKEQNKRAATKFREKRKTEQLKLKATLEELLQKNKELKDEITKLEEEKKFLEPLVFSMLTVHTNRS